MYNHIGELVRRCKSGDAQAVEELLKLMRPLINKVMRLRVVNRQDREDLMQQGYLIILESIRTYDESKNDLYPGYLKKALRYGLLGFMGYDEVTCLNSEVGEDMEAIDMIEDEDVYVEGEAIRNCERSYVHRAVEMLPERQRMVIEKKFYENRSISNIAQDMEIGYTAVTHLQDRAIKNLRKVFTGYANSNRF